MRFADRVVVGAPPASVWSFLLDPDRVVRCFPEVERLERLGPTAVRATVPMRVAFLRLAVVVDVEVVDQVVPERAVLRLHAAGPGATVDGHATFELSDQALDGSAGAAARKAAGGAAGAAAGGAAGDGAGVAGGATLLAWSVEIEPKGLASSVGQETVERQAEPVLRRAIDCLRRGVEPA